MSTAVPIGRPEARRFVPMELRALVDAGFFGPDERPMLLHGRIVDQRGWTPRRFTVDDFERMDDLGLFDDEERLELIGGEILAMARVRPAHGYTVNHLGKLLQTRLADRIFLTTRTPVQLGPEDEPQPDLALAQPRGEVYRTRHPTPADLLLVVEVMDSSRRSDRLEKLPRYAAAGVREVWLVDLPGELVEVCREPSGTFFADRRIFVRGQSVAPLAFPDVVLAVDDVLGRAPNP